MLAITAWETERNTKRVLEEASVSLGVAVQDPNSEEVSPRLVQFFSDRFSNELLRNRLSDLCGIIITTWGWFGLLLQVVVLLASVWYAFTEGPENAIHAWWALAITVFFWVVSRAFSLTCHLLNGRYPGQAKQGRKSLSELLKSQRGLV